MVRQAVVHAKTAVVEERGRHPRHGVHGVDDVVDVGIGRTVGILGFQRAGSGLEGIAIDVVDAGFVGRGVFRDVARDEIRDGAGAGEAHDPVLHITGQITGVGTQITEHPLSTVIKALMAIGAGIVLVTRGIAAGVPNGQVGSPLGAIAAAADAHCHQRKGLVLLHLLIPYRDLLGAEHVAQRVLAGLLIEFRARKQIGKAAVCKETFSVFVLVRPDGREGILTGSIDRNGEFFGQRRHGEILQIAPLHGLPGRVGIYSGTGEEIIRVIKRRDIVHAVPLISVAAGSLSLVAHIVKRAKTHGALNDRVQRRQRRLFFFHSGLRCRHAEREQDKQLHQHEQKSQSLFHSLFHMDLSLILGEPVSRRWF